MPTLEEALPAVQQAHPTATLMVAGGMPHAIQVTRNDGTILFVTTELGEMLYTVGRYTPQEFADGEAHAYDDYLTVEALLEGLAAPEPCPECGEARDLDHDNDGRPVCGECCEECRPE